MIFYGTLSTTKTIFLLTPMRLHYITFMYSSKSNFIPIYILDLRKTFDTFNKPPSIINICAFLRSKSCIYNYLFSLCMCNSALNCFKDKALYKYCILLFENINRFILLSFVRYTLTYTSFKETLS